MGTSNNPLQQFNIDDFSKKSEEFYLKVKEKLEKEFRGKYAALDFETEKYWIGETASDAIKSAKDEYPEKLFYLIQVGSPSTFTIQSTYHLGLRSRKSYDVTRSYR